VTATQVIEAELTWHDGRFASGVRVKVDERGRIEDVGALSEEPTVRLRDRALLPGFVNAHSHAFQRGLRGRGETFPGEAGSFWSWREAMYGLVASMDEQTMYALSRQAFDEMLAAGVTTVGEFHYLHHDASEQGYAFDEVVLRAAADAGIRIVLLNAYYRTGGIDKELAGGQRRFRTASLEEYWTQMDRLAGIVDPATQTLGAVAHSIRAAPVDEVAALRDESERRHMVLHMHVEEQPLEIEDCVHAYGKTPMALVNERVDVGPTLTCVHCTHTAGADMDDYLERGGTVCICPLTEANLGDGLANVPAILRGAGRICLGTDSNARIGFLEEMRWIEYGQRLATKSRGVCRDGAGRVGPVLLAMATRNGARSLGLRAGAIRPGHLADFATVDLTCSSLAGWDEATLLDALVLGGRDGAIAGVCVAGRWLDRP
jgi:formimidoylglutamate deiminase